MNKEELYDKCENMEQLYDKYYLPLQQENKELHNKIDKAIEYLINPPKRIWEGHSIDEVIKILKDSDVDE